MIKGLRRRKPRPDGTGIDEVFRYFAKHGVPLANKVEADVLKII